MLVGLLVATALAPAPTPTPTPTPPPVIDDATGSPPSVGQQAAIDVAALLGDDTKEYLAARARLAEHPAEATEALLDRLAVIPAPSDADKKRLLDVLAEVGGGDHVDLFIAELRRGLNKAGDAKAREAVLDRWLPLLAAQGDATREPLTELVGDQDLPLVVRQRLLEEVVALSEPAGVTALTVLIGRGHRQLRKALVRALARRAKASAELRAALLARIDAALDARDQAQRIPSLIVARASLTEGSDPAFVGKLAALAEDAAAPFGVRVAAVRGLSRDGSPTAIDALEATARRQLDADNVQTQAGEILAWLSLTGLPEDRAGKLATRHALREHDAPRLAALGWSVGPVPTDHAWLATSQDNPWPQVRQAALDRVDGTCADATRSYLRGRLDKDGEPNAAVARASVAALGRCGDWQGLRQLMIDERVDVEPRTEAARQLTKRGGTPGAETVAKVLAAGPDRRMARRLTRALRHAPKATALVTETLCTTALREDEVGTEATQSLLALDIDPADSCD